MSEVRLLRTPLRKMNRTGSRPAWKAARRESAWDRDLLLPLWRANRSRERACLLSNAAVTRWSSSLPLSATRTWCNGKHIRLKHEALRVRLPPSGLIPT